MELSMAIAFSAAGKRARFSLLLAGSRDATRDAAG
jgi:hypothetical protein